MCIINDTHGPAGNIGFVSFMIHMALNVTTKIKPMAQNGTADTLYGGAESVNERG